MALWVDLLGLSRSNVGDRRKREKATMMNYRGRE
jgi:hypothetical protein